MEPPLTGIEYRKNDGTDDMFALLTDRLIIIPTPVAISLPKYRALYSSLHANPSFCEMAFGHHFPARTWSDQETLDTIHTRDVLRNWHTRGMGDFAVGIIAEEAEQARRTGRELGYTAMYNGALQLVDQEDIGGGIVRFRSHLESIDWVGYAGVRDAITTSMPARTAGDAPLPPWQKMVEVRYGVAPECWGQGIAREAMEAVMQWASEEKGVKRFIAETERANARSGKVLEKMGFKLSGTDYWKEPSELEWEKTVAR